MENTIDWFGFRAFPENLPERRPGVYLITNTVNGKSYVGVGGFSKNTSVWTRCYAHSRLGSPKYLKRALDKYSRSSFLIQPVFYTICNISNEDVLQIEAKLIEQYDSIRNGYNIISLSETGSYGPAYGAIISAVRLAPGMHDKLSASAKLALNQPKTLALISSNSVTAWQYSETRKKHIDSSQTNWSDPEKKARYMAALAAGRQTPEGQIAISVTSKKHRNDPVEKAAYSAIMKSLVWITDGTKNRRVKPTENLEDGWRLGRAPGLFKPGTFDARTAQMAADPDYSRKLSEGQRKGWANDEARREKASVRLKSNRELPGSISEYEKTKGSVWITNGLQSKRIQPIDDIPDGWQLGKKLT